MSAENKQILWLNCSKTVAVLAVLVDHTNGVLYTNQDIAYASYFSVSLFIIISGLTSYFSNSSGKKVSGGGEIYPEMQKNCIIILYCNVYPYNYNNKQF